MEPGTVLLGKYRVEELLGIGGMGRVVRAQHLYLEQPVAIKILLPEMAETASRERFIREAQATVRLRSEHIARVMDVATLHDGTPLMVMEYLEGNDLNQILRHHGPQSPSVVCDLMLQACEGIAEAHAHGIVHRDIKPSNFYITRRSDGSMLLKILDFGISKTPIGHTELTGTESVIGTPTYMSPEQMKNSRDIDARCDLWSIGVVMYQLLCGRPPFASEGYAPLVLKVAGDPPDPIGVPLPNGLGEVILRCLEKDPRNRFQSAAELARMIAPFATDPIAAAASAERTARILQHRMNPQTGARTSGGLTAPVPLSPALLTPKSWHHQPTHPTNPTSVSGGAGQLTHVTRGGRGWLAAGVASLCILTGAGGYIASRVMNASDKPTAAANAPEAPPPAAAPEPVAPPPAAPVTPSAHTATVTAPVAPATIEKTIPDVKPPEPVVEKVVEKPRPKPAATTPKPKPTVVAKPKPAKPTTTKPTTTKPKPKPDAGDLFDSRK